MALPPSENRRWATVSENDNYEISDDGYLRRKVASRNSKAGKVIRPRISSRGYVQYGMHRNGRAVTRPAHRLVAAAFLDPPAEGQSIVRHLNDIKTDNSFQNLAWGTAFDNWTDGLSHGLQRVGGNHPSHVRPWTRPRGEACVLSKLKEVDVYEILASSQTARQLADRFLVHPDTIRGIRSGRLWKHITNPAYAQILEEGVARETAK
jgi:hypothetical protein